MEDRASEDFVLPADHRNLCCFSAALQKGRHSGHPLGECDIVAWQGQRLGVSCARLRNKKELV